MKAGCLEPQDFCSKRTPRCFHSGDLGDIIYSLLFCKTHLREIELFLGPDPRIKVREQMTQAKFDWLAPLLRHQPWIKSVSYADSPPKDLDYNLNEFRKTWFGATTGHRAGWRLFEVYSRHFGKPALPEDVPWLQVSHPIADPVRPVIVSRSTRFRAPSFPWQQISNHYAGRSRFVGYQSEFDEWTSSYGHTAIYKPVQDALEMARLIAGCQIFIGNQSFPMSLAMAMNVPVVQEVCLGTADCVFRRANAVYSHHLPLHLPEIHDPPMRLCTSHPNKQGLIELGPCENAYGLGDYLTVTPVAKALGNKAIMLMPKHSEKYAFLFRDLCPVQFTDNFPVYPWIRDKCGVQKLRLYGLQHMSNLPVVNVDPAVVARAKDALRTFQNPIAFCPTCSHTWAHVRERPFVFWRGIISELAKRHSVLQFGREDYPTLPGAVRMPYVSLEDLTGLYHVIGAYVGVHTGDHHLMLAVGGRTVVAEPEPIPEFHAESWRYNSPQVAYAKLSNPATVMDGIARLKL